MEQTEYVWEPESDGVGPKNSTSKEVEVWATGILCELEQLSQAYRIDVHDMSHLLKLVTSSLKELDVVLDESNNATSENSRLQAEISQAEHKLRIEQESRQTAQRSLLSFQDQHDSDQRLFEAKVRGLEMRNNQMSEMLAAKAEHYSRLMEEVDDIQRQNGEERSRHSMSVRGHAQRIESLERKLEDTQASLFRHRSSSSFDPLGLQRDSISSISAGALFTSTARPSMEESLDRCAGPASLSGSTEAENTEEGSIGSVFSHCPAIDASSPLTPPPGDSDPESGSEVGSDCDADAAAAVYGIACTPRSTARSVSASIGRNARCATLSGSPRASSCSSFAGLAILSGTPSSCSTETPKVSRYFSKNVQSNLDSMTSSVKSNVSEASGCIEDGQNLQDELEQANFDATFTPTMGHVYSENAACIEALEERLTAVLGERATLIREKSDLQLDLANTSSDLTCCRQELYQQQQLILALRSSVESAKRTVKEAEDVRQSAMRASPSAHAVVPDASVQLRKDAERLMRLYSFYRDKSCMLQEQLSRVQSRASEDSGVWRLFGKLFPFRRRGSNSGSTSPSRSTSQHSALGTRHTVTYESAAQAVAEPVPQRRKSERRARRHNHSDLATTPTADQPCSVGCPPTSAAVSTHGDWYVSNSHTTDILRFLPACVGQTALLVSPMSTICGCATTLSYGCSSTMPISNRRGKDQLFSTLEYYCDSTLEAELYRQLWVASYDNKSQIEIFDVFSKGSLRHTGKSCPLAAEDSLHPIVDIKFVHTSRVGLSRQTPRRLSTYEARLRGVPTAATAATAAAVAGGDINQCRQHQSLSEDAVVVVKSPGSGGGGPPVRVRGPLRSAASATSDLSSYDIVSTTTTSSVGTPGGELSVDEDVESVADRSDSALLSRSAISASAAAGDEVATMWIALSVYGGVMLLYTAEAGSCRLLNKMHMEAQGSVLCVHNDFHRVFVGLSDCSVAAFDQCDDTPSGWNLSVWHSTHLSCVDESDAQYVSSWNDSASIMCMATVNGRLWCTCGRTVVILDPSSLQVTSSFRITFPPISQIISVGNIVIFGSHLSPFILFYHAATCQFLQDFDLPSLARLVDSAAAPLLGVTSMQVSSDSLWVGCSNGVLLSLPLHATQRYARQGEGGGGDGGSGGDKLAAWHDGQSSGVVSYKSARVSHWCHMGPVVGLIPVTVPRTGTSREAVFDVIYSCGVGSLDMRAAEPAELQERQRVLAQALQPRPPLPRVAAATDPLTGFLQQGEHSKRMSVSSVSSLSATSDNNHFTIMTWRTQT